MKEKLLHKKSINCNNPECIIYNQVKEYKNLITLGTKLLPQSSIRNHYEIVHSTKIHDIVNNENTLDLMTNYIRKEWMKKAFFHSVDLYRSPEHFTTKKTLNQNIVEYDYERTLKCRSFENNIHHSNGDFDGFSILFSSAMAAIDTLYTLILRTLRSRKKVSGLQICGYYENILLSSEYRNFINIDYLVKEESFHHLDFDKYDFYLVEPIRANFDLSKTDLELFLETAFRINNNKIRYFIFDSSLLGSTFPIDEILNKFKNKDKVIICSIRSGLKLDQEGMEFSNCGLLSFYFSKDLNPMIKPVYSYLEDYRGKTGKALNFYDICMLDNDYFFMNPNYAEDILENTYDFYQLLSIKTNNVIKKVVYPYADRKYSYYKTPYLFIKLQEDKEESYKLLLDILIEICEINGCYLNSRNSFGFRNISVEYFQNIEDLSLVFKIAPGKLKGYKFFLLIEILNYISEMDLKTFKSLRPYYKDSEKRWSRGYT